MFRIFDVKGSSLFDDNVHTDEKPKYAEFIVYCNWGVYKQRIDKRSNDNR